jgi:hypothetical protein
MKGKDNKKIKIDNQKVYKKEKGSDHAQPSVIKKKESCSAISMTYDRWQCIMSLLWSSVIP